MTETEVDRQQQTLKVGLRSACRYYCYYRRTIGHFAERGPPADAGEQKGLVGLMRLRSKWHWRLVMEVVERRPCPKNDWPRYSP